MCPRCQGTTVFTYSELSPTWECWFVFKLFWNWTKHGPQDGCLMLFHGFFGSCSFSKWFFCFFSWICLASETKLITEISHKHHWWHPPPPPPPVQVYNTWWGAGGQGEPAPTLVPWPFWVRARSGHIIKPKQC